MNNNTGNLHEGHRKRMRDQFLAEGSLNSFPEHKILEMLLFYAIPRSDTNELAHSLISTFGSFNAVLDAPYESLIAVKGIGERSALLIKMIPELIKVYGKNKAAKAKYILSTDDCVQYIRHYFETIKNETLIMVCLNNACKILRTVVISEGESDFTRVNTRKILNETLLSNATQVILAHNHPGGLCAPSKADVEVTREIAKLMRSIRAKLANHIIICDNDYFSFASTEKFASFFVEEEYFSEGCSNESSEEEVNHLDGNY